MDVSGRITGTDPITSFGDKTLASALAALSGSLDDPSIDIRHSLAQLVAAVRAAVPSYCGLSITVVTDGIPVTIDAPTEDPATSRPAAVVATSLVVPLAAISILSVGELVLFASTAGAFVDVAADLAYATATELVTFETDTRLESTARLSVGVDGFSTIQQAIGLLISRGYTPDQARARIARVAADNGHDLVAAAKHIVLYPRS